MSRRLAPALVVATLIVGCGTARNLLPRTAVREGQPWVVPVEAYPTQRLYRLNYRDPEDRVDLKLALYLESADRFRLQTTADLGRKLWTLDVASDVALWIDHREEEVCRTDEPASLEVVPLAGLPVVAVPRVLLGLLPMPPHAPPRRPSSEGTLVFDDATGRTWNAGLTLVETVPGDGERWGEVRWWSLVEAGEQTVWWRWQGDDGALLVDPAAARQLRWGEIAREALARPLGPPRAPEGYRQVPCGIT